MIINKLSAIMGTKRLKISDVVKGTGLARNTVSELYYDRVQQININTLNKLCNYLNVNIGEILEFTKDENPSK
ncbi:helix-turn-helix domain-containing protein [Candidatus Formimonas warabiya]|uniref:Cro/Cl family transcriptional regulator n=1 Tax=Formimonas warabiya TaxID=1761012 RepID=A0A3G1KP69_FORW1|nr:helix-turn-helix transcriptional regulator [Candidatus Formimonas warabiya]ATW24259.1 Cro/Cl family transcriptional regulator [Candidatus Formimonas warabiya]